MNWFHWQLSQTDICMKFEKSKLLTAFPGPSLHGPIVRMSFQMILSARPTVEMQNLLPVPRLTHCVAISAAEASGVSDASASCYGLPKNVLVFAVVKPEGKLVQVQRQILPADMMKRADHSAFQQAPKAVNVAGVNYAPDVFARGMAHGPMCVTKPPKLPVALVLVGSYQRHLFADGFTDEVAQGLLVSVLNDSADHVPLARDGSDDSGFPASDSSGDVGFLVPMAILVLPTYEGLIDFHNAHEFLEILILHSGAKPMAHVPSGRIGAPDLPLDLKCADAFFAVEHLPEHFKPRLKPHFGIVEDGSDRDRESVRRPGLRRTRLTCPMPRPGRKRVDFLVPATRAGNTFGPSALHQKFFAGVLRRIGFEKLFQCHHANRIA